MVTRALDRRFSVKGDDCEIQSSRCVVLDRRGSLSAVTFQLIVLFHSIVFEKCNFAVACKIETGREVSVSDGSLQPVLNQTRSISSRIVA